MRWPCVGLGTGGCGPPNPATGAGFVNATPFPLGSCVSAGSGVFLARFVDVSFFLFLAVFFFDLEAVLLRRFMPCADAAGVLEPLGDRCDPGGPGVVASGRFSPVTGCGIIVG